LRYGRFCTQNWSIFRWTQKIKIRKIVFRHYQARCRYNHVPFNMTRNRNTILWTRLPRLKKNYIGCPRGSRLSHRNGGSIEGPWKALGPSRYSTVLRGLRPGSLIGTIFFSLTVFKCNRDEFLQNIWWHFFSILALIHRFMI